MATLPRITIPDPANQIQRFGTGALYRLERGTSSAMSDASEITTALIVATQTEYEYADPTGVAGTSWYRARYSTATPTLSTHYSGYGPVFQAGAPSGEIVTLEQAKGWVSITDTVDDAWLPVVVNAANGAAIGAIGVDLGPSPDTSRTYDGDAATLDGRRLRIPGGIRAFTAVEVSTDGGSSWTAVTTDVRVGPSVHSRPFGEPGAWIEFRDPAGITGSYSWFPPGMDNVRISATAFEGFGWSAYPALLVQATTAAIQRAIADRRGRGDYLSEADMLRYFNQAVLKRYHDMYFRAV